MFDKGAAALEADTMISSEEEKKKSKKITVPIRRSHTCPLSGTRAQSGGNKEAAAGRDQSLVSLLTASVGGGTRDKKKPEGRSEWKQGGGRIRRHCSSLAAL